MVEALLALALGFKHGLDPDHLALIDSLVRNIRQHSPRIARITGFLFSLGHSLAICLFTTLAVLLSRFVEIKVPAWLEISGVTLSASALILLAIMNLASLKRRSERMPADHVATHPSPKNRLGRVVARSPLLTSGTRNTWRGKGAVWGVMLMGALFAMSFDTMTQAALFAGLAHGKPIDPSSALLKGLLLSAIFGLGMVCADTVNGLFVNKLLDQLASPHIGPPASHALAQTQAAQRSALAKERASNFMTVSLSLLSLMVASLALAKLLARETQHASLLEGIFLSLDGQELTLGLGAIAWVLTSYFIAASIAFHTGRAAPTN